jgi:hypothetical protein
MLSVVLFAARARVPVSGLPVAMARSLASLVTGAVEGVIRDVTLAVLTGTPDARLIADHAGCALAEAGEPGEALAKALAAARSDLIMVLSAGYAPEEGFIGEVSDLVDIPRRAALMRVHPYNWVTRVAPALCPVEAVIAHRHMLPLRARGLPDLRRKLVSARTLRTRLRPVV